MNYKNYPADIVRALEPLEEPHDVDEMGPASSQDCEEYYTLSQPP